MLDFTWPISRITKKKKSHEYHIDGLVRGRSNCSASAMELQLSYAKPSIYDVLGEFKMWPFIYSDCVIHI